MDDLRSEVRAAFEKEQAAHPPGVGLRPSTVAAVARQPRRAANLEWLAVAAAILLGVLVVAGLIAQRLSQHATTPVGAPTASPGSEYGQPPAGVPLLFVHDAEHPTWLVGYDWTGQPRGTLKLSDAQPEIGMAPDGQSFAIGLGAKGGNWQFFDRLGQPVATPSTLPGAYSTLWADDNQHVCSMTFDQQTLDYTLWTALPGQPIKRVMVVAHDPNVGQSTVSLAACSFKNDLAIAVRTTISYPSEMWEMRLSDGKILAHHTYPSGALADVVASTDGAYIAENATTTLASANPNGAVAGTIRRVADWSVVTTLPSGEAVVAFNGDDSNVLVSSTFSSFAGIVNLQTGSMVWRNDRVGLDVVDVVAQPGGSSFALGLMIHQPAGSSGVPDPLRDVVIVKGDGTATQMSGRYELTW
jgi:hypothetical protein